MGHLAVAALSVLLGTPPGLTCDIAGLRVLVSSYPSGHSLNGFRCYRGVSGADAYLSEVLQDNTRAGSWPMAVAVLGVIGSEPSYDALVGFLAEQRTADGWGRMSRVEFDAKVDAILMLDYQRRYSPDSGVRERAGTVLNALTKPDRWRRYPWVSPVHGTRAESDSYLASKAKFALQRTGSERP